MNLSEVLNRATDEVVASGLAVPALVAARERRARRRTVAGTAAAVVAIMTTVTVLTLSGETGENHPAPPVSSSTTDSPVVERPIGPRWDPHTVGEAPLRDSVLPSRLVPPDLPPKVAADPMPAAVVAWPERGSDVRLLGADGRWRCIPGTASVESATLSVDGRQVAMATDQGVLVVDVTTAAETLVPWPRRLAPPWDNPPPVEWLPDGSGFYIATWPDAWFVGWDGSAEKAPFGHRYAGGVAIDPEGAFVEKRYSHYDLRVWLDGKVSTTAPVSVWGERLVTRFGRVAFTGGGSDLPGDGGPIVLDAATGEVVAYRPIRDPHSTYSDNGHLTALGFLDADTVLYLVGPGRYVDRRLVVDAWHLVTWDVETGEFERVSTGPEGMRMIDVAVGVLAGG